jgi:hypothetical protein
MFVVAGFTAAIVTGGLSAPTAGMAVRTAVAGRGTWMTSEPDAFRRPSRGALAGD